jgi:acyl carrier protein
MSDTLAEEVFAALAKVKRIPKESITLDSTLESLELDSLDTILLLFDLEDAAGVKISDEQARSVRTVGDIVEAIRRVKSEAAAGAEAAGAEG